MGFEQLTPTVRVNNSEMRDTFRIGVHVVTGKAAADRPSLGLVFVIGTRLLEEFGFVIGGRVNVMEGTDGDLGTFLIRKADGAGPGAVKITAHSGRKDDPAAGIFRVNIQHSKTLQHITAPTPLEPATWQRFGGQLFVIVPWAAAPTP